MTETAWGRRRTTAVAVALAGVLLAAGSGCTRSDEADRAGRADRAGQRDRPLRAPTVTSARLQPTAPWTTLPPLPTTVPPAIGAPRSGPVVVTGLGLLGWWDGSGWVSAEGKVAPLVGGETFAVLEAGTPPRDVVAGTPKHGCADGHAVIPLTGGPSLDDGIALLGVARPVPHPVALLDTTFSTYERIAARELRRVGVPRPEPVLRQLVRADLDGDGTDEILIAATNGGQHGYAGPVGRPEDASVVFMRRVTDGRVRTVVLADALVEPVDDVYGATSWTRHRIAAIADANGDGVMEVFVAGRAWESHWIDLFDGSALLRGVEKPALAMGCEH